MPWDSEGIEAAPDSWDPREQLLRLGKEDVAMTDVAQTIKSYILRELLPGVDPDELTAETELIATRILDSLSILRLRAYLEEEYGIEIGGHELDFDNFGTIADVEALVRSRLG